MVPDEVSGKVAVLEGEGRLGPAAQMFRKCAAWDDVVNCSKWGKAGREAAV